MVAYGKCKCGLSPTGCRTDWDWVPETVAEWVGLQITNVNASFSFSLKINMHWH